MTFEKEVREVVEKFRKQALKKSGGIGFEEAIAQLTELYKRTDAYKIEKGLK
jgi:hypothetical protein